MIGSDGELNAFGIETRGSKVLCWIKRVSAVDVTASKCPREVRHSKRQLTKAVRVRAFKLRKALA